MQKETGLMKVLPMWLDKNYFKLHSCWMVFIWIDLLAGVIIAAGKIRERYYWWFVFLWLDLLKMWKSLMYSFGTKISKHFIILQLDFTILIRHCSSAWETENDT